MNSESRHSSKALTAPARGNKDLGANALVHDEGQLDIKSEGDIVGARKLIREIASTLGFGLIDVTRIVTAASELARNVFQYAGSGVMHWRILDRAGAKGLELVFTDNGPGMADIDQAMQPGFTTGRGMGLGLPGARRLMDAMSIRSTLGQGTVVEVTKWVK